MRINGKFLNIEPSVRAFSVGHPDPINHYIFMTVLVHVRKVNEKELLVQQLPGRRLVTHAKPFGREPNALLQRCN